MKNDLKCLYGNGLGARYDQMLFRPLSRRVHALLERINFSDDCIRTAARAPQDDLHEDRVRTDDAN